MKGAILKTIREYCLSCCNGSSKEVDDCAVGNNRTSTIGRCQLYPYRLGKDPLPSRSGNNLKSSTTECEISENHIVLGG